MRLIKHYLSLHVLIRKRALPPVGFVLTSGTVDFGPGGLAQKESEESSEEARRVERGS